MALRLMIWKGWLLRADNFINPCVPYFSFNRNVSHTSSVAEVTPKMMHTHWLMRKRLSKYIFYSSFSLLTFATKK